MVAEKLIAALVAAAFAVDAAGGIQWRYHGVRHSVPTGGPLWAAAALLCGASILIRRRRRRWPDPAGGLRAAPELQWPSMTEVAQAAAAYVAITLIMLRSQAGTAAGCTACDRSMIRVIATYAAAACATSVIDGH